MNKPVFVLHLPPPPLRPQPSKIHAVCLFLSRRAALCAFASVRHPRGLGSLLSWTQAGGNAMASSSTAMSERMKKSGSLRLFKKQEQAKKNKSTATAVRMLHLSGGGGGVEGHRSERARE